MRWCWAAALAAFSSMAGRAFAGGAVPPDAASGPVPPDVLSGIEQPAQRPAEPVRKFTNALLWPIRLTIDLLFLATGTAGGLLENEQIVPRTRDFFFTPGGQIGVFPTFFVETGTRPNIGARFIANVEPFAATMRAGYGGRDENVAEARMRWRADLKTPAIVSLEALHDRRSGLGYLGIGQSPETDPRNHFLMAPGSGVYREKRERVQVGVGLRALANVEVLFSSSITQRYIADPIEPNQGPPLTSVFAAEDINGALIRTRIFYTELALRLDTRENRASVDKGVLFEGYAGVGQNSIGTTAAFARAGLRAAVFMPVAHPTTILSPKIVIDGLSPGRGPIPFTELPRQPTFRGFDNRRDYLSAVASLDYRWHLVRFVAGRLFFDMARVFPSLSELSFDHLRWVAGLGVDLSSSTSELGRIALAAGPEGINFMFTLGVPARFGDRQHRD